MSESHRMRGRAGYAALLARYGAEGVRQLQRRGGETTTRRHGTQHRAWGRAGGLASARSRKRKRAEGRTDG